MNQEHEQQISRLSDHTGNRHLNWPFVCADETACRDQIGFRSLREKAMETIHNRWNLMDERHCDEKSGQRLGSRGRYLNGPSAFLSKMYLKCCGLFDRSSCGTTQRHSVGAHTCEDRVYFDTDR